MYDALKEARVELANADRSFKVCVFYLKGITAYFCAKRSIVRVVSLRDNV